MMRFDKYEGLGNDFIVVDSEREGEVSAERAIALCDRHLGVGADGVLLLLRPATAGATTRMLVLNADGSRPEMCGNGIRCVALHLALRDGAPAISYVIDTDAGPRRCEVERDDETGHVLVDMGRAEILGEHQSDGAVFTRVSVGNPHAVTFELQLSDEQLDELGPRVSGALEGGSNVELAKRSGDRRFEVRVWERGVGRTMACGTGACATAAAAVERGLAKPDQPIEVLLPGGPLEIVVASGTRALSMRGPARRVFSGELA